MGLGKGARGDHLMCAPVTRDAVWAFDAYEAVRDRLPQARYPARPRALDSLADLAQDFDVFLLDAFGVLNVGESPIPGAPERIAALQAAGKRVIVVSNAASYPKRVALERFGRLGFDFTADDVLSSRDVLIAALTRSPPAGRLGLIAPESHGFEEFDGLDLVFLADDPVPYAEVDGFVMMSSVPWTDRRQALLETALTRDPRPVWVGNPDLVAPRETGLTLEPGHYAHRLADATGVAPEFFGKPYGNVFDMVRTRLAAEVDPGRIVMVGDTLHTDILGGAAAGLATALVTDHGALKDLDIGAAIARSRIVPDFILPAP